MDKARCPECARVMRYRKTLSDYVCTRCKTEFAFTVGRWWAAPLMSVKANLELLAGKEAQP